MSDISEILKRRKFGIVEEIKEESVKIDEIENIIPLVENTESIIIPDVVNDEMSVVEIIDDIMEVEVENIQNVNKDNMINANEDATTNILNAKDKILSTNQLENLIDGIKYFEKQANYSFFFLAHCFYKIRENLLYRQHGYENFTDFIRKELKDYSYKTVYNFLSVAETFSLNDTDNSILDLGMTKLILISSIKERSTRKTYLQENMEQIENMSSRELRQKVNDMNKINTIVVLPDNFEHGLKNNVNQLKDKILQFSSFLNNLDTTEKIDEDNYEILKNEIKTMEEVIKEVKDKITLRLQQ